MTSAAALRKAAILVSALDTLQADLLLEQMGETQSARVREAIMELRDVPDLERDQVLGEFLAGGRRHPHSDDSGIEIDDSLARRFASAAQAGAPPAAVETPPQETPPQEIPPFRFLHEMECGHLAVHLQREHPQTIAVVVSHLAPDRAAELLAAWPPELQSDVIHRVARLDQTRPEVLQDIERELESLLTAHVQTAVRRSHGTQAVAAILRAMPSQDRRALLSEIAHSHADLASELDGAAIRRGADDPRRAAPPPHPDVSRAGRLEPRDPRALLRSDRADQKRPLPTREIVAHTVAPLKSPHIFAAMRTSPQSAPQSALRSAPRADAEDQPQLGDRYRFEQLASLDARSLALVMHHTDPKLLLLSMAGADRGLFERMKRELPAAEVRQLQRRLAEMGPWRLSDLDGAQEAVARSADRLAARGLIPLPPAIRLEAGV